MHISDYMFHRLNGHLQAVYIHKQKNYIFKYHFKGLDFLKVFWYAFYNTKICDLSLTPYNGVCKCNFGLHVFKHPEDDHVVVATCSRIRL